MAHFIEKTRNFNEEDYAKLRNTFSNEIDKFKNGLLEAFDILANEDLEDTCLKLKESEREIRPVLNEFILTVKDFRKSLNRIPA